MTKNLAKALFILLVVFPSFLGLGYAVGISFGLIGLGNETSSFTLDYWENMFAEGRLLRSIIYTVLLAATAILGSTMIALAFLTPLLKRMNGNTLPWFYFLPLGIPPIVASFFSFTMLSNTGFISRVAYKLGFIPDSASFPILINDSWGIGVWMTHVMLAFPFFLILFISSAKSLEVQRLTEAAASLGASSSDIMKKVVRPIVVRKNAPLLVIWFIFVMGTYEIPLLLGGQKTRPVALVIIDKMRGYSLSTIPEGYAMSAFYALFIVILAFFLVKLISRRYDA